MHPLTDWRKKEGYSLKEAAEVLGVPFSTLTDWIYLRRYPRGPNLSLIEEKTNKSVTTGDMHHAWMAHHHPEKVVAAE